MFLAGMAVFYCFSYYFSPFRPDTKYPLGWYGWADQGEYFKQIVAFAKVNLSADQHHYPPLYAMVATPFYFIAPKNPQFFPDLIFFLFYLYVLIKISARIYGVLLAPAVVAVVMFVAPLLTITQWVVPWTTSLQSALLSVLFLIVFAFERRPRPFVLVGRQDRLAYCAFFLAYGALLPTRPLDFVVAFPLALFFFLKTMWATVTAASPERRTRWIAALVISATLAGLPFVALFFGFNLVVFKNLFGPYANAVAEFRYDPSTLPEKAYSIFLDSGTIYGEAGQAFFEQIPLLGVAFAICAVTAVVRMDIRRWIVVIAFFNILLYLPYGDLLPTGVFRYFNLHYFKWMYPWLFVIAVGQAIAWARGLWKAEGWRPLVAAVLLALIVGSVSVVPTQVTAIPGLRTPEKNTLSLAASEPLDADFIDITGLSGGFTDFYFGNHLAILDAAQPIRRREFRLLPIPNGARMLFSRPAHFSNLVLTPDPGAKVMAGGTSSVGRFRFTFACRLHNCSDTQR